MINETTYRVAAWLLGHGLWYDTAHHTDPDGRSTATVPVDAPQRFLRLSVAD